MNDGGLPISVIRETWRGWDSILIETACLRVRIVPELGGRTLEYQAGEHAFLWCNPNRDATSSYDDSGQWMNWGGDKVWLAPQGWDNEEQWAGPPDPVLDGGRFDAEVTEGLAAVEVRLTSQPDLRSGVQVSRTLHFRPDTTWVDIVCTMTNIDSRPRRWGLWPVAQIDAASRRTTGMNTKLRACVPIGKHSAYDKGFRVIYGDAANPQYTVRNGVLEVNYLHAVGKIGADSDAGWTVVLDGETGAVLVMQMAFEAEAEYPDGASVEIWTNGLGTLQAYGRTESMPDSLERNPYMLECELVSPFAHVAPGETYQFAYAWAATNIGADDGERRSIRGCNAVCCEVEAFGIATDGKMSGRFGIFHCGRVFVEFVSSHGDVIDRVFVDAASPLEPFFLQNAVTVPADARWAVLSLYAAAADVRANTTGYLGEIARVDLQQVTSSY